VSGPAALAERPLVRVAGALEAMSIRCQRCARPYRRPPAGQADDWFAQWRGAEVIGHVCPECQTPSEREEVAGSLLTERVLAEGGEVIYPDRHGRPRHLRRRDG
jgi:hypothetical protein